MALDREEIKRLTSKLRRYELRNDEVVWIPDIHQAADAIEALAAMAEDACKLAEAASMCLPATDEPLSKDAALRLGFALTRFRSHFTDKEGR